MAKDKKQTLSAQFDELDTLIDTANDKHGVWQDLQAQADAAQKDYETAAGVAQSAKNALTDKLNNVFPKPDAPIPSDAGRVNR